MIMNLNFWSNFTLRELCIFISPWNNSIVLTLAFILRQFIVAVSIYLHYTIIELFKESSVFTCNTKYISLHLTN
jgi:hypothetical protein